MMLLCSFLLIINSLILTALNPLALGVMIIFQSIALAFLASSMLPSFWFSYILILVYLGGLLVLFIYVATLASNEQLNSSPRPLFWAFLLASLLWATSPSPFTPSISVTDNFNSNMNFTWMFSSSSIFLAGALMIYLFIALVAVVKITKWWGGSLRPQTFY